MAHLPSSLKLESHRDIPQYSSRSGSGTVAGITEQRQTDSNNTGPPYAVIMPRRQQWKPLALSHDIAVREDTGREEHTLSPQAIDPQALLGGLSVFIETLDSIANPQTLDHYDVDCISARAAVIFFLKPANYDAQSPFAQPLQMCNFGDITDGDATVLGSELKLPRGSEQGQRIVYISFGHELFSAVLWCSVECNWSHIATYHEEGDKVRALIRPEDWNASTAEFLNSHSHPYAGLVRLYHLATAKPVLRENLIVECIPNDPFGPALRAREAFLARDFTNTDSALAAPVPARRASQTLEATSTIAAAAEDVLKEATPPHIKNGTLQTPAYNRTQHHDKENTSMTRRSHDSNTGVPTGPRGWVASQYSDPYRQSRTASQFWTPYNHGMQYSYAPNYSPTAWHPQSHPYAVQYPQDATLSNSYRIVYPCASVPGTTGLGYSPYSPSGGAYAPYSAQGTRRLMPDTVEAYPRSVRASPESPTLVARPTVQESPNLRSQSSARETPGVGSRSSVQETPATARWTAREAVLKMPEQAMERNKGLMEYRTVLYDPYRDRDKASLRADAPIFTSPPESGAVEPVTKPVVDSPVAVASAVPVSLPTPQEVVDPVSESTAQSEEVRELKAQLLRDSVPDTSWSARPVETLRISRPALPGQYTVQNFEGPFFTDELSSPDGQTATGQKSHEQQLNDWWWSGNKFARQEEFYQSLVAVKEPKNASPAAKVAVPKIATPRLAAVKPAIPRIATPRPAAAPAKPAKNPDAIDLGRLMIPALENLASYVEGPMAGRRDYFSRWAKAPEWCIDRSPEGNNSFFDKDWGNPPARIGRDARYRDVSHFDREPAVARGGPTDRRMASGRDQT